MPLLCLCCLLSYVHCVSARVFTLIQAKAPNSSKKSFATALPLLLAERLGRRMLLGLMVPAILCRSPRCMSPVFVLLRSQQTIPLSHSIMLLPITEVFLRVFLVFSLFMCCLVWPIDAVLLATSLGLLTHGITLSQILFYSIAAKPKTRARKSKRD